MTGYSGEPLSEVHIVTIIQNATVLPAHSVPWRNAFSWCTNGVRLWRRASFMLILFTLVTLAVEAVLQRVPMAGVVLSKIIVPVVDAGVLLGLNDLAKETLILIRGRSVD
ncbi:MAG: hypothetical protein ABI132_04995 [Rhodanobacteraceae bacterium]